MNKNLTTTNQNAKLALNKSKSLLDITNKLLSKKDIDTLVQSFNFTPFVRENGHSMLVESVAISPDGKTIVSGSKDDTIKIWDIQSGECLNTLEGHSSLVSSVAISPDGKTIVSGSGDETIKVWDIQSGECLKTLKGHSEWVSSVTISPDGKTIASGSIDKSIKIWDIQSGECLKTLKGHSGWVSSVTISPCGKTIASGSRDKSIKIWDIKSGKLIYTTYNFIKSEEYFAAIDPDGYFYANNKAIDEFLRVSEEPLSQRKLTDEEIKHFRKKGNFLEVGEIVPKSKVQEIVIIKKEIPIIGIDEDEIPF